jgi:hypothetical protein
MLPYSGALVTFKRVFGRNAQALSARVGTVGMNTLHEHPALMATPRIGDVDPPCLDWLAYQTRSVLPRTVPSLAHVLIVYNRPVTRGTAVTDTSAPLGTVP